MRTKISNYCAVSHTRKPKWCHICGERLNKYGVIIYKADSKDKRYCWVHQHCILSMNPRKMVERYRVLAEKRGFVIISLGVPCSYCGKTEVDKPILNFHEFLIHDECIDKLANDTERVFEDKGGIILAESI